MTSTIKKQTVDIEDLQDMVASNDSGGRNPYGISKYVIIWTAIAWSLFQIYYASPLPYWLQEGIKSLGWGLNVVVDDTKARSIHLAFAIFLAYLSYRRLNVRRSSIFRCLTGFLPLWVQCYVFIRSFFTMSWLIVLAHLIYKILWWNYRYFVIVGRHTPQFRFAIGGDCRCISAL